MTENTIVRELHDDELLMVSGGDKKEADHSRYEAPKPPPGRVWVEKYDCTTTYYSDKTKTTVCVPAKK